MTEERLCKKCGSNWDGGSVLEEFFKQRDNAKEGEYRFGWTDQQVEDSMKECYSPPYRWGREIGIQLPFDHPNYYDGISYWQCPDCKTTFNRFTGKEEIIKL
jgi:hypothetical protein